MDKKLEFLNDIEIAHRGLCKEGLIENSMSAFRECVKRNIPIELDVHVLKDNTLLVMHDDDTFRMCGKKLILKNSVYDDIKDLKLVGTDEKIPLLSEVLELIDGKVLLDIELKYDVKDLRICIEICKLLDKYKGRFIIKSFNPVYVYWFKRHRKDYIRGLLIGLNKRNFYLRMFEILSKPLFVCFNYKKLPNKKIARLYNRGIPILLYTIKEKANYCYTGIIFEK